MAQSPGPDRWRLRLRAPTCPASLSPPSPGPSLPGGAVAGLRPARWGPRPVAVPLPGQDQRRLCRRACTGEGFVSGLLPAFTLLRQRRPWAKSRPICVFVQHRCPWAKSPLKFRTFPAENWAVFSQPSLGPMAASQRLQQISLTAITLQIWNAVLM